MPLGFDFANVKSRIKGSMRKDWQIKKLGEVCEFQGGSQPPKEEWIKEPREGYIRMLQIRDFTQSRNFDIEYVKETNKLRLCNSDDILLGRYGASVGKVLTGLSGAYNVAILKTIPSSDFYKPFIKYYFQSPFFQNPLLTLCNQRAAQAGFNREDIYDFPIPYLTLEEQKRIVAVLDKKFAQIETLKTAAEKSLQNTKQLFQAELAKAFSNTYWEKKQIKEVCDSCLGKMLDKNKNKGIPKPYLANINVRWGSFDLDNLSLMKFEEDENERYGLKYGDLIVCEGGEPGRCAIWKDEMPNMKIQKALHRVRCHENLNNYFLYYYFVYLNASDNLAEHFTGTTIKHLPGEKLKNIELPLPPLEEQKRIVAHLDSLSEKVHQLEEIYTKQLADCDELKQAYLQKAFEGEL